MTREFFDGSPDAVIASFGLANTGYTPWAAVADVVDNSIAAGARIVSVRFQKAPDATYQVVIGDNGCGMTEVELKKAMVYGTDRSMARSSLSVYGMGLKMASSSFSRKFTVVTRDASGSTSLATWDLDLLGEMGWKFFTEAPQSRHMEALNRVAGNGSGTVVIWERADLKQKKREPGKKKKKESNKDIETEVKNYLSMVFHRFIEGTSASGQKVKIFFNEQELEPFNPVHDDFLNPNWTPLTDSFSVTVDMPNGTKDVPYSIKSYLLNGKNDQENRPGAYADSKQGMKLQGIFPYRADRLLHEPKWFDIINFHPDFNSLRIILELDPALDPIMSLTVNKDSIDLPEQMYDDLVEVLQPYTVNVRQIIRESRKSRRKLSGPEDPHRQSNTRIEDVAKDIKTPDVRRINSNVIEIATLFGTSETYSKEAVVGDEKRVKRIEVRDSLDDGLLWEPRFLGQSQSILLNRNHPFYQKVYLPLADNVLATEALDFLMYALTHAEFMTRTDRQKEQFQQMRMVMSSTLRNLVAELPDPEEYLDEQDD